MFIVPVMISNMRLSVVDDVIILGDKPCYADFIVGGWLRMFSVCLPREEWEEVSGWHGGVFGKLFDGLRGVL